MFAPYSFPRTARLNRLLSQLEVSFGSIPSDGKGTQISVDELVRLLSQECSHKGCFYHYTTFGKLEKIINSNEFWISHGSRLNDQFEFEQTKKWKLTYVGSFTHSNVDNVAMWVVYVLRKELEKGDFPVRIGFPCKEIYQWFQELRDGRRSLSAINDEGKESGRVSFEAVSFHDVAYGDEFVPKETGVGRSYEKKLRVAINNVHIDGERLTSFWKQKGWSYEHESRLVVTLSRNCIRTSVDNGLTQFEPGRLSVPLNGLLQHATIRVGPCKSLEEQEKCVQIAQRLLDETIWRKTKTRRVQRSSLLLKLD